MRLAIIAVIFVIVSLAAIVGPNWVALYVLPVVVIVGVGYGALIVIMRGIEGWPERFGHGMFSLFGREKEEDRRRRS